MHVTTNNIYNTHHNQSIPPLKSTHAMSVANTYAVQAQTIIPLKPLPPLPTTTRFLIWENTITSAIDVCAARPTREWDIQGKYNAARPWMLYWNPTNAKIHISSFVRISNHNMTQYPPVFYAQITSNIYIIRKDYIDAYTTVDPDTCPSAVILRIPLKWFSLPLLLKFTQPKTLPENEKENEIYMRRTI